MDLSLVDTKKISVHFDGVDVPGHLGFGEGYHPPQVLEET